MNDDTHRKKDNLVPKDIRAKQTVLPVRINRLRTTDEFIEIVNFDPSPIAATHLGMRDRADSVAIPCGSKPGTSVAKSVVATMVMPSASMVVIT